MPYLPIITSKQLVKLLKAVGFVEVRQRGSHLTLQRADDGKNITVPIHSKNLGIGLTHSIIKEAGLTKKEVKKMLN